MNTDNNQPTRRATMTDHINHRAEAEWMLYNADVWAAQAGELSPKAASAPASTALRFMPCSPSTTR